MRSSPSEGDTARVADAPTISLPQGDSVAPQLVRALGGRWAYPARREALAHQLNLPGGAAEVEAAQRALGLRWCRPTPELDRETVRWLTGAWQENARRSITDGLRDRLHAKALREHAEAHQQTLRAWAEAHQSAVAEAARAGREPPPMGPEPVAPPRPERAPAPAWDTIRRLVVKYGIEETGEAHRWTEAERAVVDRAFALHARLVASGLAWAEVEAEARRAKLAAFIPSRPWPDPEERRRAASRGRGRRLDDGERALVRDLFVGYEDARSVATSWHAVRLDRRRRAGPGEARPAMPWSDAEERERTPSTAPQGLLSLYAAAAQANYEHQELRALLARRGVPLGLHPRSAPWSPPRAGRRPCRRSVVEWEEVELAVAEDVAAERPAEAAERLEAERIAWEQALDDAHGPGSCPELRASTFSVNLLRALFRRGIERVAESLEARVTASLEDRGASQLTRDEARMMRRAEHLRSRVVPGARNVLPVKLDPWEVDLLVVEHLQSLRARTRVRAEAPLRLEVAA